MDDSLSRLLHDVAATTGAALPGVAGADAPVPDAAALDDSIYFVGLIGGKEVGKSSLVNALVGQPVVTPTGFGRGTSRATAYAHESAAARVRQLLQNTLGNRFDLVFHASAANRSRVLLDLPDIDSIWTDHVDVTRTLLRLMLYPVWVQSVEKYADRQPLELLRQVAAGNDPANFLFVLNKVDQVVARYGNDAVAEIKNDYARRLQAACGLAAVPSVFATSANDLGAFDLPALTSAVTTEKSQGTIRRDRDRAEVRQGMTALAWIDEQNLPARRERVGRLLGEARERCTERLAVPLIEEAVPRLLTEPGHRMALAEPIARVRLARWPIVNVIDAVATPLVALVRANLSKSGSPAVALDSAGLSVAPRVRAIFAELAQTDPSILSLYATRKLWEETESLAAAAELGDRVRQALERQKHYALETLAGGRGTVSGLWRLLLTIGAVLWFPIVQPVMEIVLSGSAIAVTRESLLMLVRVLGATYLLQSLTLLSMYFVVLWMLVRWGVYYRTERLMKRLGDVNKTPAELNPSAAALAWIEDLLGPLHRQFEKTNDLIKRIDAARPRETKNRAA